jgi:hypothetical protein
MKTLSSSRRRRTAIRSRIGACLEGRDELPKLSITIACQLLDALERDLAVEAFKLTDADYLPGSVQGMEAEVRHFSSSFGMTGRASRRKRAAHNFILDNESK